MSSRGIVTGVVVIVIVMVAVVCAGMMGCQNSSTQAEQQKPQVAAEKPKPVVDPMNPPSGSVRQVWYNGDCVVDIGTEAGVENGDWLLVMRNGETVQYLEVSNAKPYSSYCRVATPEDSARPRVEDTVMLEPKNLRDMHAPGAKKRN